MRDGRPERLGRVPLTCFRWASFRRAQSFCAGSEWTGCDGERWWGRYLEFLVYFLADTDGLRVIIRRVLGGAADGLEEGRLRGEARTLGHGQRARWRTLVGGRVSRMYSDGARKPEQLLAIKSPQAHKETRLSILLATARGQVPTLLFGRRVVSSARHATALLRSGQRGDQHHEAVSLPLLPLSRPRVAVATTLTI